MLNFQLLTNQTRQELAKIRVSGTRQPDWTQPGEFETRIEFPRVNLIGYGSDWI